MYAVLNFSTVIPNSQRKWETVLERENITNWNWNSRYCLVQKTTRDTKLQALHFNMCSEERETINHLLVDCTLSQNLWGELETWLSAVVHRRVVFWNQDTLLGWEENSSDLWNHIIILTKQYIYASKCKGTRLNIVALKNIRNIQSRKNYSRKIPHKSTQVYYEMVPNSISIQSRTKLTLRDCCLVIIDTTPVCTNLDRTSML